MSPHMSATLYAGQAVFMAGLARANNSVPDHNVYHRMHDWMRTVMKVGLPLSLFFWAIYAYDFSIVHALVMYLVVSTAGAAISEMAMQMMPESIQRLAAYMLPVAGVLMMGVCFWMD